MGVQKNMISLLYSKLQTVFAFSSVFSRQFAEIQFLLFQSFFWSQILWGIKFVIQSPAARLKIRTLPQAPDKKKICLISTLLLKKPYQEKMWFPFFSETKYENCVNVFSFFSPTCVCVFYFVGFTFCLLCEFFIFLQS